MVEVPGSIPIGSQKDMVLTEQNEVKWGGGIGGKLFCVTCTVIKSH